MRSFGGWSTEASETRLPRFPVRLEAARALSAASGEQSGRSAVDKPCGRPPRASVIICPVPKADVITRVLSGDELECKIVSPQGERLRLTGKTSDVEPEVEGSVLLGGNRALVNNAWAFAKFTHLKVHLPTQEEQKQAEKRADAHQEVVEWLADLADDVEVGTKEGWCSSCFTRGIHRKGKRPVGHLPAYLCGNCGSPTLPCADPTCVNMAVRDRGAIRMSPRKWWKSGPP